MGQSAPYVAHQAPCEAEYPAADPPLVHQCSGQEEKRDRQDGEIIDPVNQHLGYQTEGKAGIAPLNDQCNDRSYPDAVPHGDTEQQESNEEEEEDKQDLYLHHLAFPKQAIHFP